MLRDLARYSLQADGSSTLTSAPAGARHTRTVLISTTDLVETER